MLTKIRKTNKKHCLQHNFVQIPLTDDQQTLIEPINNELNMHFKFKIQAKNCKNELLHM